MNRKLWIIALAIFFILYGLLAISNFRFESEYIIMGVLAIGVGILALLDK